MNIIEQATHDEDCLNIYKTRYDGPALSTSQCTSGSMTYKAMTNAEEEVGVDNPKTTQTLEYTKDKYNVKIRKQRVSPKVPPTTYKG
jgi:hypothetical protein